MSSAQLIINPESKTMNPIIPMHVRQIGNLQQQTVNARELWQFVESQQEFAHWIKNRIEKYGFVENEDYILDKFSKVQLEGGREVQRPVIDYHLTMDTAKELAMVEANDKGREVRKYFIACERQAKAAHAARVLDAGWARPQQLEHLPPHSRQLNSMINRRAFEMAHRAIPEIKRYLREKIECEQDLSRDHGDYGFDSKSFIAGVLEDCYQEEMIRDLVANI